LEAFDGKGLRERERERERENKQNEIVKR